jgi:effector-binding domain-containing protein
VTDQLLDKYAPVKHLSKKQLKQRDKPWIDNDILKSIKDKDNVYRKLISEKNPTRRESYKADCNKRKNEITKNIRLKKKAYYKTYFQKHSQNAKKMWAGINEIIHTKSKNNNSPNCIEQMLNNEKVTITDPKSMSNAFNTHYVNVAEVILKQRKYPGCKASPNILKTATPILYGPASNSKRS